MDAAILVGISLILASILAVLVFRRKSYQEPITKPTQKKTPTTTANHKSQQPSKKPSQPTKPSTTATKPKAKKPQSKPKPKENTELSKELNEQPKSFDLQANQPTIEPDTLEQLFQKVYLPTKYERLQQQSDTGNNQYYLQITPEDEPELVSQLEFRLKEGLGEAIFEIGIQPDGTPLGIPQAQILSSLEILRNACSSIQASMTLLRGRDGANDGCMIAETLIRKLGEGELFFEVRVAVVGNVDTGKSTLLGVLSHGALDNGRGKARANIFKHQHEIKSGRTSDIGREILGFDKRGNIVNYSSDRTPNWSEICEQSSKLITFMDLAGHEKYLKTTVFGLTGNYPDYCMMMIGSNMGVIGMTKEHYHLSLALKVPCFFVVTKIDICPANVLESTLNVLRQMLRAPGSKKIPMFVNNEDDVVIAARTFNSDRLAPIFQVSNVTGTNLHLLRMFLNLISPKKDWSKVKNEPALFHIDNTFSVTGVGTVVSGTLMQGQIGVNQTLLLGPDEFGKFKPVIIKGVHTNRLPVKIAYAGQSVSVALKKIKRASTRKGQVIAAAERDPQATWEFDADIFVITHSTTINTNYEAVIHCGCTRQTATIVQIEGVLRAGLRGRVRFRYKYRPEFIQVGERLIFREGKTKGIGNVAVLYHTPTERSKSRKERKEEITLATTKSPS